MTIEILFSSILGPDHRVSFNCEGSRPADKRHQKIKPNIKKKKTIFEQTPGRARTHSLGIRPQGLAVWDVWGTMVRAEITFYEVSTTGYPLMGKKRTIKRKKTKTKQKNQQLKTKKTKEVTITFISFKI